ncbi:hypothetical protein [Streptomyces sp. NPDC001380]|uniref:hypothetical protein n=1 Tax=Streptomyces sp. NPDC001380 TaxID=3364566 RepID=UPI0036AF132C
MCRTHGLPGEETADAWTSPRRTPPYYPDAVTLRPGADPAALLARIDHASPGCTVKDSFADLDLAPAGFRVLFDAQWIHRPPGAPVPPAPADGAVWRTVRTAAGLEEWQRAWAAPDGPPDLFRPALLDDPAVRVLAAHRGGRLVAGAVAHLGGAAAGVSNVFTAPDHPEPAWPGLLAALAARRPAPAVVGYEHGGYLDGALRHGFRAAGPLRVWIRPD